MRYVGGERGVVDLALGAEESRVCDSVVQQKCAAASSSSTGRGEPLEISRERNDHELVDLNEWARHTHHPHLYRLGSPQPSPGTCTAYLGQFEGA